MSNDRRGPIYRAPIIQSTFHCDPEAEGHCITCSDQALQARVLRVDQEAGLALVTIKDTSKEIDITLVESVAPGDILLVHGGVAIARVDEASDE